MGKIFIKGCTIVPISGPVIEEGVIAVDGDRLYYVGPANALPAGWQADTVIKADDKVALPGLVNAHTHAAMALLRSYADDLPLKEWLEKKIWPREARLTREDIYWGTKLALLEMIRSGTTTFADMYFNMDAVAEAVLEAGLRGCLSQGLIGFQDEDGGRLASGVSLVKEWQGAGDGRITTMLGPHAPYTCPPEYLTKVADTAAGLGVGLHIHLAETKGEVADIQSRYGATPIALANRLGLFELPVLAAHCVHLTAEDISILAEKKVGVAHCPESNLKLASGVAPVKAMLSAGVNVAIGTDGAASNNNLDMVGEIRTCALLAKGISGDPTAVPAHQALVMATLNGARALGLDKKIGTLEAGKKADLILVNKRLPHMMPSHNVEADIVYAASGNDVDTVIVNGKILMSGGEVKTLDVEEIYAEVKKRAG
ncbi:amidohydrolase [Neomoorella humiferrea]|uniref:5-methylthioadenosine/S-adenosylhomocysteine deaminase n=1 Tax=Neomoorella humiferrea TaxID=676965 RepID=A0A2T0AUL1_9FIRM|nr:amidohydrolase [Moorella humiferrea]PRR74180.1 5-methylthioadenosine/S-adenosylhomocysteine deaminase [Moorella humiferrea]